MGDPTADSGSSPEAELVDLEALKRFFEVGVPFHRFLGLKVLSATRGEVVVELPFRAGFIGDPERPALHGGIASTLADAVGGAAVFSLVEAGDRVATLDLRIDYLRPGRLEALRARGEVIRRGKQVGVCSMTLFHPCLPAEPIAVAKGVYTLRLGSRAD